MKFFRITFSSFALIFCFLLVGCNISNQNKSININIIDSDKQSTIKIDAGLTVSEVLSSSSILLDSLDKIDPSPSTILLDDATIIITRVKEEFVEEESIIPFEQQTVKNESLPEGQSVLIQAGVNGTEKSVYRVLKENGIETSRSFVSSEITLVAKPEIIMIGVQSPYSSEAIDGIIAYISSSNAWIMEGNSGNRHPVVSTGDLDGRIFSVSPDREWLLFSRTSTKNEEINSLWIVNIEDDNPEPISLHVPNVVHYADWVPGRSRTITYSSVEFVPTPPGWQANNDLILLRFNEEGNIIETRNLIDVNSGGLYGWWGTTFEWSTDGSKIAYARPDSIGIIDLTSESNDPFIPLIEMTPYQTSSEWAWVPNINWSDDGQILFTSMISAESPTIPGLTAILLSENKLVNLVSNCGLFCFIAPSHFSSNSKYVVAYLSAIIPDQSETSRYNLKIMDRDGSNQTKYYPEEGIQGLDYQQLKWSPSTLNLIFIAQGNLMEIDTSTGSIHKLTGDGSITLVDWK